MTDAVFYPKIGNPVAFVINELPLHFKYWVDYEEEQKRIETLLMDPLCSIGRDENSFSLFRSKFRTIVIHSGRPRLDYGQTCYLYSEASEIRLRDFIRTAIPEGKYGEDKVLMPSQIKAEYRYKIVTSSFENRGDRVCEEFLIYFQDEYYPKSFNDLSKPFSILREKSEIFHDLSIFEVRFLQNEIYVKMEALKENQYKPEIKMSWG